jgi:hypothetical protein
VIVVVKRTRVAGWLSVCCNARKLGFPEYKVRVAELGRDKKIRSESSEIRSRLLLLLLLLLLMVDRIRFP